MAMPVLLSLSVGLSVSVSLPTQGEGGAALPAPSRTSTLPPCSQDPNKPCPVGHCTACSVSDPPASRHLSVEGAPLWAGHWVAHPSGVLALVGEVHHPQVAQVGPTGHTPRAACLLDGASPAGLISAEGFPRAKLQCPAQGGSRIRPAGSREAGPCAAGLYSGCEPAPGGEMATRNEKGCSSKLVAFSRCAEKARVEAF